ncbi:hypothetical protein [Nostoc sp.]|uniref:hypothetical protein n=1 Tax=Nostoc sp. TaxID=1180 RepID=UPI002FFB2651
MSPFVITVETHEDLSHKLIIQQSTFGCLYGVISGWLGVFTIGEHPNFGLNLFPHPQPLSHLMAEGRYNSNYPNLKDGIRG